MEPLLIRYKNSSLSLLPNLGCKITSLILNRQEVLDRYTDIDQFNNDPMYKNCFLLPFPNRVNKGMYTFEGTTYQLPINEPARGHALHGLLFQYPFSYKETKENETNTTALFSVEIPKDTFAGYPYAFSISLQFVLEEKKLTISATVTNNDNRNLPYGVGWHPYLTLHKKIDECDLDLPSTTELEANDVLIPTEKQKTINPISGNLGDKTFDTCFTNLSGYQTRFGNIILFQDSSMDFLQVYTPEARDSIAIEPMSCAPNAFNNGFGLLSVKPSESFTHSFGLKII